MTKEKIIQGLKILSRENNGLYSPKYGHMTVESICTSAIELINQQTCEDAISREVALSKKVYTETEEGWSGYTIDAEYIENLPSVNQQKEEEGHWEKEVFDLGKNLPLRIAYQCSECGEFFDFSSHYCPNCGARMKEGD